MSEGKINRLRRGATLEVFSSTSQRKRLAEVKQHVYTPTDVHFGHIDSAFQSQEYIAQLIRQDPHDVQRIVTPPKQLDDDKGSVDDGCWLYEQLRRLAQDLSYPLITNLQLECNRESCPEMKAGEWLYLCVAHGNATGGHVQCCAIDYIVHTLDSATALLNSTRVFPSRLSVPQSSYRHFSSLARRLSRIFAHAFYHHRELFSQAEAESSLYARFLALSRQHELVPAELLVIPSDGFDTNASNHSNHEPEDRRDPGSPQSAIEASDEGTFLPSQSEKDAARRLFEEWTANKGQEPTEEDEEAEGPEEEVGEINGDSRDVPEQESSIPAAQEDQVKPKEDEDHPPVPEEPHAEKEPQVEAAPEPEPEHKSGPEPAPESEEKKDESESSPSLEKPANGEDRAPSPIKEVNSSHEDKDETKEKGQDQAKGESNPEQPKDTA